MSFHCDEIKFKEVHFDILKRHKMEPFLMIPKFLKEA